MKRKIVLVTGCSGFIGSHLVELLLKKKNYVVVLESLENVKKGVYSGDTLTKLFLKDPLFPPTFSQLISVGEQTGNLDEMFTSVSNYYEEGNFMFS